MSLKYQVTIVLYCIYSCFLSQMAMSYDDHLEFESLLEEESKGFNKPKGAEYQSDVLTYQKPEEWEYQYLKSNIAADFSFGSISGENFSTANRFKAKNKLNDLVEVRFHYFDEKDFEKFSEHIIAEFIFWPWQKYGISLFGEPSFRKAEDDIGLASYYKPNEFSEYKLFITSVDTTRYKRNDRTDTFDKNFLPYVAGLIHRSYKDDGSFLQYGIRHETKSQWNFPDQNLMYQYKKSAAHVYLREKIQNNQYASIRFQWDDKLEIRNPIINNSTPSSESWTTKRYLLLMRYQIDNFLNEYTFKPGLMFAHRDWLTSSGNLYYNDILPHFWFKIPSKNTSKFISFWDLGLESTLHQFSGTEAINTPGDKNRSIESRFNLAYEFNIEEKASLRLIATADLDRIGKSDIFQGGCGQFRFKF